MNESLLPIVSTQERETAEWLAQSDFVPKDFKGKAANIIAAAIHGSSLGMDVMQSMQSIAVVNGRPSLYGDAALALVQRHPEFEDIVEAIQGEGDERRATCEVKRKNRSSRVVEYSVARAKTARLWGKQGPWQTDPDRMLQMRARSYALRDTFADALKGFDLKEVVQDYEPIKEVQGEVIAPTTEDTKAAPASKSASIAESFNLTEHAAEDIQPVIEAQSATDHDKMRLDAMIENIKNAESLATLRELQEPAATLKRKLFPSDKAKITYAFNQRSSELSAAEEQTP